MGFNKKKHGGAGFKKKTKVVINFDEEARKDYLTGFHKRRQQRKEKAQDEISAKLKKQIKDEKNKRRKVAKENMTSILQGAGLLDEGETIGGPNESKKVVDLGSHEVVITSGIDFNDTGILVGNAKTPDISDNNEGRVKRPKASRFRKKKK